LRSFDSGSSSFAARSRSEEKTCHRVRPPDRYEPVWAATARAFALLLVEGQEWRRDESLYCRHCAESAANHRTSFAMGCSGRLAKGSVIELGCASDLASSRPWLRHMPPPPRASRRILAGIHWRDWVQGIAVKNLHGSGPPGLLMVSAFCTKRVRPFSSPVTPLQPRRERAFRPARALPGKAVCWACLLWPDSTRPARLNSALPCSVCRGSPA